MESLRCGGLSGKIRDGRGRGQQSSDRREVTLGQTAPVDQGHHSVRGRGACHARGVRIFGRDLFEESKTCSQGVLLQEAACRLVRSKKLVGQGITRSEASASAGSSNADTQDSPQTTSSDRASRASCDGGERNSLVGPPEHPVEEDPWTRYCLAYAYAGRMVARCGRKMVAQMASEKYGVLISDGTARRASLSHVLPNKQAWCEDNHTKGGRDEQ